MASIGMDKEGKDGGEEEMFSVTSLASTSSSLQETSTRRLDLWPRIEEYIQECRQARQGPDDGRCERGPEKKTMGVFQVRRKRE